MKGRAFLFLEAGQRVYRFQFTKDLTLIGCDRSNDIVIRDDSLEPTHARISRAGPVYTLRSIEDAEVRVDGEELEGGYELMNGNRIEVGDTDILFAREQQESPTTVHLVIRKPGEPPMGFWSKKSTVVIGREKGDIIIDDPLLSKVHTIIENFCEGGHFVLDARSERGTGLNGESIEARHRIRDGDVINLGGVEIEFRTGPFADGPTRDASQLAADRVQKLRRLGDHKTASGPGNLHAPRNPYQRYPSALPDADPPSRGSSADSRPHRPPAADAEIASAGPGRRTGLDLKSGLQTGIVNVGKGRAPERRPRPRPTPRRRKGGGSPDSNLPSNSTPRRPEPTYEPESLPNFEPRPHWGAGSKRGRSFGDRPNEMDTRLSRGTADDSGLWYLPAGAEGASKNRAAPKPIIRARGDKIPEQAPQAPGRAPAPSADPNPGRARIRRPAAGPRGSGSAPIRPMRAPPDPAPQPRHQAAIPAPRVRGAEPDEPTPKGPSPGARPDDQERWYIPEKDQKSVRQRKGEGAWYLPDAKEKRRPTADDYKDEYGDRHVRPAKDPDKKSGGTQVFDGDDY